MDYLEAIDETSYLSVPNAMERTAAVGGENYYYPTVLCRIIFLPWYMRLEFV